MSVKELLKGDTAYVPPPDDNFVWYKAENERLREALAWAYNLRHLRGHSDPVVIPERFAPFIEAALRRDAEAMYAPKQEDKT